MITFYSFPKCGTCGKDLLPVEDVSKEGVVYLKGWVCMACKTQAILRSGDVFISDTKKEGSGR